MCIISLDDGTLRTVRMKLRAKGRKGGVKAVYSIETPKQWSSIAEGVKTSWFGKDSIKPTFGVMTALIGYSVASYVLCDLAGQMYKYGSFSFLLLIISGHL